MAASWAATSVLLCGDESNVVTVISEDQVYCVHASTFVGVSTYPGQTQVQFRFRT